MIYEALDRAREKKHPMPAFGIDRFIWFLDWITAIIIVLGIFIGWGCVFFEILKNEGII